jgi:predicted RecA/RadA family phage recombinase
MKAIYKQKGDSIDYVPAADVAAGDVVVLGDLVAIAKLDIKAGELGALAVSGVFSLPKTAGEGEGILAGKQVYWDESLSVATDDSDTGANKSLGKAIETAANDDERVLVRLSQ